MVATGSESIAQLQRQIIDFGQSAGDAFRNLGVILKENLGLIKTIGVSLAAIWTLSKISAAITGTIALVKNLNKAYKILRATAIGTAIAEMAVLNPLGAVAYGAVLLGVIAGTIKAVDLLGDAYEKAQNKKDGLLNKRATARRFFTGGSGAAFSTGSRDLAAEAAARANAAATAKLTQALKDQLKLAKAKAIFDMQKIQIEAALKGQLTEEERIRLLLMKAIADENVQLIDKYTKALDNAQKKTLELQLLLDRINATKLANPAGDIFYKGMSDAQIALELFRESGGFRLTIDTSDFYAGLSQAQIDLEKFRESGGFRRPDVPYVPPVTPVIPPISNGGGAADGSTGDTIINVTAPPFTDPNVIADLITKVFQQQADGRGNVYGLGLGSKDTQYVV